jgi:hypothetical protein
VTERCFPIPELDPQKFSYEERRETLKRIQSFCPQAGECTYIDKDGNPGIVCERKIWDKKDGMDQKCYIHDPKFGCPFYTIGSWKRDILEIRKRLDPWWKNLYRKIKEEMVFR